MAKQTIAVLFGGQSSEHEVSCMSAANVIDQIDRAKYDLILVGITQQGHWVKVNSVDDIRSGGWRESRVGAALSPDAAEKCLIIHESSSMIKVKVDMVFPVLHGLWGEDGTVQGLCRLAEIPYVGCGVAASAVCMDKGFTKQIVSHLGIRQAAWELITSQDMQDMVKVVKRVESRFSYPVFVKPCNAGSSCGVVKAHDRDELAVAFREAARRYIPEAAAQKKKLGFPVPIRIWLRQDKYYGIVKKAFLSKEAQLFFHTEELMKLLDAHRAGREDYSRQIWTVYTFLVWYRQYFVPGACSVTIEDELAMEHMHEEKNREALEESGAAAPALAR